ncbi:MAG: aspartate--tRNA(Asn) ligase [Candidatus Dojkabacteria bacterium]|nr:MAG: aspartate--tRNA(Asn) ligase [Candidatus Dojkabacteria bacterium]
MERILASNLKERIGEKISVRGWLQNSRIMGKLAFLVIRDRTGLAQIVIENQDTIKMISPLQPGSVIYVSGVVSENEKSGLGVEIINPEISIVSKVTESMPLEVNKEDLNAHIDTILDYRPLSLRNLKIQAVFKIQATLVRAYREYLTNLGFTEFFGPNIIGASSEGGAELFKVDYFGSDAMLSQSAQLYKQIAVGAYERVFALMKCYRAEKSNTRRHLTEATQFEFEMGFIDDFSEVMDMLEGVVKSMISEIATNNDQELKLLGVSLALAPQDIAFPRVTFKDALQIFFERTGIDERGEIDLSPQAEKELCAYAREQFGTDFIFVTHFLRKKTAFYAKPNEDNPEVTNYFDLLCREIEIVSGGQRINDHDELVESLKLKGLNPDSFQDYLSIFKFGMPPHGGFGMGMERFTMMALGLDNIRMATLFPSDTRRIASVKRQEKIYIGAELGRNILKRLDAYNTTYRVVEHEPVTTSEEAAKVRGTSIEDGIKALILRNKKSGENIMVCIPANDKVDFNQLAVFTGAKFEFESKEVIASKYALEAGGIPPFGNLMGLRVIFSDKIKQLETIAFNNGSLSSSVIMSAKDLIDTVDPEFF